MKDKNAKIFVAGHNGLVGSAIIRILKKKGFKKIITASKKKLDLRDQKKVFLFLKKVKPKFIINAAASVGGIAANNKFRADFIYNNVSIQTNLIHSAFKNKIKNLIFLGSSCVYPRNCRQPIKEKYLLTGTLEKTNEPYAIAKIAGIKMCESYNRQYRHLDFRSIMPSNLYGPGDNYHPINSHVIPGLIYRFYEAKKNNLASVTIWGSGKPKREFLYVDDMARAAIYIMNLDKKIYNEKISSRCSHINVGSGTDLTIKELAETIKDIIGFTGDLIFDTSKHDGTSRKLLDSQVINNLGFKPQVSLRDGLLKTYEEYIKD